MALASFTPAEKALKSDRADLSEREAVYRSTRQKRPLTFATSHPYAIPKLAVAFLLALLAARVAATVGLGKTLRLGED